MCKHWTKEKKQEFFDSMVQTATSETYAYWMNVAHTHNLSTSRLGS